VAGAVEVADSVVEVSVLETSVEELSSELVVVME
jgi:hypothetical protein